jgi:DNA-binding protein Alba
VLYVGKRAIAEYIVGALMILNEGSKCTIKAGGRKISRAADLCEILKNRFLKDTDYNDIRFSTEDIKDEEGNTHSISFMEIDFPRSSMIQKEKVIRFVKSIKRGEVSELCWKLGLKLLLELD